MVRRAAHGSIPIEAPWGPRSSSIRFLQDRVNGRSKLQTCRSRPRRNLQIHTVCWTRGPAGMAKSLSQDLRSRLITAVAGGMSRRAAAERFGVSAASAVRWVRAWRETGRWAAKRQGGDRRSEPQHLGNLAQRDAHRGLSQHHPRCHRHEGRHREHRATFAPSTVWRFLDRHAMTLKKNGARSRAGQARRRRAAQGLVGRPV